MDAQDITLGQRYVVGPDPTYVDGTPCSVAREGDILLVRAVRADGNVSGRATRGDGDDRYWPWVDPRHLTPYVESDTIEAGTVWVGPVGSAMPATDYTPPLDVTAVVEWIRRLDGQASAFAAQRDAALRDLQRAREEWTAEVASAVRERDEARAQEVATVERWSRAYSQVVKDMNEGWKADRDQLKAEVERLRAAAKRPIQRVLGKDLFDVGLTSVGPDDLDNGQLAEHLVALGWTRARGGQEAGQ